MGFLRTYEKLECAKMVCISFVLSFAAGGLMHTTHRGEIDAANKAGMFILIVTVCVLIAILCTVGIRRWKKGQLDAFNKLFLVFSLVMHPAMFVAGWWLDIFER